ncbi:hypothetical protein ACFQ09_06660 [Massilia norwichensis]|jgi:hypothetical protein|uniref:Peptidase M10 metallopeptidase domain-containing protein n=1 Tax=Massilia norwichensis TaxID=1442366 RepID=A0ABT2AAZ4_9BURK|nr:hypothetical protein [Massilia norwichensis]MCS0591384.1 hypothetical protein [Massilia norwichensis]
MQSIGVLGMAVLLSACGGGQSDAGNAGTNQAVTDAQIVASIQSSNIDFVPGANGRLPGTWRWAGAPARHVTVHIPPPSAASATEQDYANKVATSVSQLNAKLSGLLVLDISNSVPASGNYIHVSYGTSFVPPGSTDYLAYCANVSTAPNQGSMIMPGVDNGITSSPVFINLGNGHCDVTQAIVTHEFGHALGLANHFPGFGVGIDVPALFWDVLTTLYANPQSTTAANLVVKHAPN